MNTKVILACKRQRLTHTLSLSCRERIRGKDVRRVDRVFIVRPDNPQEHMMKTKAQVEASPLQVQFCTQRAMTVA